MPKKVGNKPDKVAWKGFVQCEMNSERKKQFKAWTPKIDDLESAIQECLSPGYKLSFSVDTFHDTMQVSWYCSAEGDRNAGWCLTARGATIGSAFLVLLFKHTVILETDWTSAPPLDEDGDGIG